MGVCSAGRGGPPTVAKMRSRAWKNAAAPRRSAVAPLRIRAAPQPRHATNTHAALVALVALRVTAEISEDCVLYTVQIIASEF